MNGLKKLPVLFLMITSMVYFKTSFAVSQNALYPGSLYCYFMSGKMTVNGRQGVASDNSYYYISGTKTLAKYDKNGMLKKLNKTPFVGREKILNHLGGISILDDKIYAAAEWFDEREVKNLKISIYDANNLYHIKDIPLDLSSGQREGSAVAIDEDNHSLWVSSWLDDKGKSYIYEYDIDSGRYKRKVEILPYLKWIQGVSYVDGKLYITADDGDADKKQADGLYRIDLSKASVATAVLERKFSDFNDFGEIEGVFIKNNNLLVLANRGMKIINGIPKKPYPGYKKEVSEVYLYKMGDICKRIK
ncbi:hypothetical protein SAMN06272783_4896 [Serratia sp. JKS296]|uniref:YncE family protein n=1 Tax=Serratia sp. JKS296 TaxID=1938824 RepID=UPI000BD8C771|nr:hypothetical protein [Serratia sp. JKS296]SOD79485.1 hypothetical protein SAMN06272783_4896 [Serratia sp. JKS296]